MKLKDQIDKKKALLRQQFKESYIANVNQNLQKMSATNVPATADRGTDGEKEQHDQAELHVDKQCPVRALESGSSRLSGKSTPQRTEGDEAAQYRSSGLSGGLRPKKLRNKTLAGNHAKNLYRQRFEDSYVLSEKILGQGAQSVVKVCQHKLTKMKFAVKIIRECDEEME